MSLPRPWLLILCCTLAGCAEAGWQRLFYDVGDQLACQQRGAHQGVAAARAAECGDAGHPDRSRYDDYREAREQTLGAAR